MIISRTPYRISFFGGGTDYPAWSDLHGGAVLAAAIDKYCYITCRHLPPFLEHRIRIVYAKMESCQTVDQISHPAVREILKHLQISRGLEIHHDGDLPARSGMGSSSSFTVGLLHALHALQGVMASKHELAEKAIYVEQQLLQEVVGCQDQVMAAYGGFNHVEFSRNGGFSVKPVTIRKERLFDLMSHLMLFYTGIRRTASDVASTYGKVIDRQQQHLQTLQGLVTEGLSTLNSGSDISHFGKLLHEAWQAKRNLSSAVSNNAVDEIYAEAIAAGAIGGKLTGAGGGGFMLLFVPPSHSKEVKKRLNRLIQVPFRFDFSGSQVIFYDPEMDYSAEDIVRSEQKLSTFCELAELEPKPL